MLVILYCYIMLEKINSWDLLPGEFYFLKSPIANIRIRKARMIRYKEASGLFDAPTFGMCLIDLYDWTFYRYVSCKEYKEKLEKNIMQHD